jgi:hypothetical protein
MNPAPAKPVIDLDGNEVNSHGKPYRMGMVFRCNLDGSEVETLAWNFRNNYEVCVDSFGTVWQSDNDDDGNKGVRINYVMEYGNFGYTDEMTGAGWGAKRPVVCAGMGAQARTNANVNSSDADFMTTSPVKVRTQFRAVHCCRSRRKLWPSVTETSATGLRQDCDA